jgi:hypothetical protein
MCKTNHWLLSINNIKSTNLNTKSPYEIEFIHHNLNFNIVKSCYKIYQEYCQSNNFVYYDDLEFTEFMNKMIGIYSTILFYQINPITKNKTIIGFLLYHIESYRNLSLSLSSNIHSSEILFIDNIFFKSTISILNKNQIINKIFYLLKQKNYKYVGYLEYQNLHQYMNFLPFQKSNECYFYTYKIYISLKPNQILLM